jgi:group I intron endonuclease
MNKFGIIYKATSKTSGKSYIGQTMYFERRKQEHKRESNSCWRRPYFDAFHCAIRKYGWDDFEWDVIEENIDVNLLDELESKYIQIYNTFNNGYNMTLGGHVPNRGRVFSYTWRRKLSLSHKGFRHTNESKKKISEKIKGRKLSTEHIQKIAERGKKLVGKNNPMYGRHHTEETKRKMSNIHKGKTISEEHKRAISKRGEKYEFKITDPDGNIEITTNMAKYCREHKITKQTMLLVAHGKQTAHRGYHCEIVRELPKNCDANT